MRLTPAQVQSYRNDGYLVVEDVFPLATIDALCARLDWLCEHWEAPEARQVGVMQEADIKGGTTAVKAAQTVRKFARLTAHEPDFRAFATGPLLVGLVSQLIGLPGQPLYLADDQAFMKPPRVGSRKELHQDNAYFLVTPDDAVVTAWCALDDATVDNGCMHYVPGSHAKGLVEHESIPGTPHMVPKGYKLEDAVPAPVRRGGIVFHHGLALHYSPPNLTDRWRRAFACHYVRGGGSCGYKTFDKMTPVG